jgi:hypothetical protein
MLVSVFAEEALDAGTEGAFFGGEASTVFAPLFEVGDSDLDSADF